MTQVTEYNRRAPPIHADMVGHHHQEMVLRSNLNHREPTHRTVLKIERFAPALFRSLQCRFGLLGPHVSEAEIRLEILDDPLLRDAIGLTVKCAQYLMPFDGRGNTPRESLNIEIRTGEPERYLHIVRVPLGR